MRWVAAHVPPRYAAPRLHQPGWSIGALAMTRGSRSERGCRLSSPFMGRANLAK
jgi:hypothetical protein